ncbi:MAG: ATP-dependent Clp protease ATP-binding subunit, partial [Prevotella sp.]|nr:ATP-dependent Clp protease ATP-binding subunit [Prevotella sp.]
MRLASRAVGPEHMMLGILRGKNSPVKDFLTIMDIDMDNMKESLEEKIHQDDYEKVLASSDLYLNEQASNILKLAVLEARVQHMQIVDEQHLLLAMLHDQTGNGVKSILEDNNMTYKDALAYFQKKESQTKDGIDFPEEDEEEGVVPTGSNDEKHTASQTQTKKTGGKTPVIDAFATDLTQAARDGKLDPVVGRSKEMQRVVEILCRRKKNNPILIGEPGVGKSAIVEGLAQM